MVKCYQVVLSFYEKRLMWHSYHLEDNGRKDDKSHMSLSHLTVVFMWEVSSICPDTIKWLEKMFFEESV